MSTRLRGLLQFLVSVLVFAGLLNWLSSNYSMNNDDHPPGGVFSLIAITASGAFAMAGLIQLISGMPFSELSRKWNSLNYLQRGVYATGIFLLIMTLLAGGVVVYLTMHSS